MNRTHKGYDIGDLLLAHGRVATLRRHGHAGRVERVGGIAAFLDELDQLRVALLAHPFAGGQVFAQPSDAFGFGAVTGDATPTDDAETLAARPPLTGADTEGTLWGARVRVWTVEARSLRLSSLAAVATTRDSPRISTGVTASAAVRLPPKPVARSPRSMSSALAPEVARDRATVPRPMSLNGDVWRGPSSRHVS